MARRKPNNSIPAGSWTILILYLVSSFFGALIFSLLAFRAKRNHKNPLWWILLSLIFMIVFGYVSWALFKTSSPKHDAFWYYLGLSTLISNGIALFNIVSTIFTKRADH